MDLGFSRLLPFTLGLIVLSSCLGACGPEATPFPVNLPTLPAATITVPAPGALRYAVAPDALPYLTEQDRRLIAASAEIVPLDAPLPDDLGTAYQIVVSFSDLPDATEAPSPFQLSLLVNPSLAPLDNPEVEQIVRAAVNSQQIAQELGVSPDQAGAAPTLSTVALRTDLANAGYPDGFDLTLAAEIPSVANALVQQFAVLGIEVRVVPLTETTHLILTSTENPANAVPLLTTPIRYRAAEGFTVTFTPSGFPIIAH